MSNAILGARIFGVFCALGLIAGVVAGTRHERLWGVTALAIVLNAVGVLGLAAFSAPLCAGRGAQAGAWPRHLRIHGDTG
jgi:hypothetical protein